MPAVDQIAPTTSTSRTLSRLVFSVGGEEGFVLDEVLAGDGSDGGGDLHRGRRRRRGLGFEFVFPYTVVVSVFTT